LRLYLAKWVEGEQVRRKAMSNGAQNVSVARSLTSRLIPRTPKAVARLVGWLALAVGVVVWTFAATSRLARRTDIAAWELQLNAAVEYGAAAAVAVGLAVFAVRRDRRCWIGWVALVVSAVFVVRSADQIGRWLTCDYCARKPASILFSRLLKAPASRY
jgi:hypothetical protein